MSNQTLNERVASLETRVDLHKTHGDNDISELKDKMESIDAKLNTLLELKHKGAGAFWLASAIFGTGIVSIFYAFLDWIKGVL